MRGRWGIALALACLAARAAEATEARYTVRLAAVDPPRFAIQATLPGGDALRMDSTRPGDLPALLEHGWPALVSDLRVLDGDGQIVALEAPSDQGWGLPAGTAGPLTVSYEVRTEALAAAGWPAPREALHVEDGTLSVVGRALFVTTSPDQRSAVSFALPRGWRVVTAWPDADTVPTDRLTENLLVLTRTRPDVLRAGGFTVSLVALGPWRAVRGEAKAALHQALARFVAFLPVEGRERYLAVLLPMPDRGAESYRQSLALTFPDTPTADNRDRWANLLVHEVFHYWNGWALHPADYGRSQWFHEGFTEYAANTAIGLDRPAFLACLADHVANARRLTTSLEETGGRKGPPLYSAGALVAFAWDVQIQQATGGRRDLRDFWSALWRGTGQGSRAWDRGALLAALEETAPGPWAAFLDTYVKGAPPLRYAELLSRSGLRLVELPEGGLRLEEDPAAVTPKR